MNADPIAALRSADPAERERAADGLHDALDHQGIGRSEDTAAALPALIDHVCDPAAPDRGRVARLVAELAVGDTCWFLHDGFHPDRQTRPDQCARAQTWVEGGGGGIHSRAFAWIGTGEDYTPGHGYREIYELIASAAPRLAAAIGGADDDLRASLPFLCAWLTTRAAELSAPLRALLADPAEAVRASAALGLSHVAKFDDGARELARDALLAMPARSPLEQRCRAMAIVRFEEPDTSAAVRPVIASWLSGGVPRVRPPGFPWFRIDSPPLLFCTLLLGTAEDARGEVIDAGLAGLPRIDDPHDAADLAVWLIRLARERAFDALIASPAAWHFTDVANELRNQGYPDDRDTLAQSVG